MQRAATFRGAQPEAGSASIDLQNYLDDLVGYMGDGLTRQQAHERIELDNGGAKIMLPYSGAYDNSTALYPGLGTGENILKFTFPGRSGYQIHLDGYGPLVFWRNPVWTLSENEPSTLAFEYPADAPFVEGLCRPNTITLRDKDGYELERFMFSNALPQLSRSADGELTVRVNVANFMQQLKDEMVTDYVYSGVHMQLASHIASLLAYQESDTPIVLGDLSDPVFEGNYTVSFNNRSIYDCLQDLYKQLGDYGQFAVTPQRRLEWRARLGSDLEVIRLGRNMKSLERSEDTSNFATRIIVNGGGLSSDTRAGGTLYENNVSTYGVVTKIITIENITDSATLNTAGVNLIAEMSVPNVSYRVDAIDLSEVAGGRQITLGSLANVNDEDLDIAVQVKVSRIIRRLDASGDETYELARKSRSIQTVIESLNRRVERQETRDFKQAIQDGIDGADLDITTRTQAEIDDGTIDITTRTQAEIDSGTIDITTRTQAEIDDGTIDLVDAVQDGLDAGDIIPRWVEYTGA